MEVQLLAERRTQHQDDVSQWHKQCHYSDDGEDGNRQPAQEGHSPGKQTEGGGRVLPYTASHTPLTLTC